MRYVVKDGDSVASLAKEHAILPETIWNHPDNFALSQLRKDMNVLMPGDVVMIPEMETAEFQRPVDDTHRFQLKATLATYRVQVFDFEDPRAGQNYTLLVDKKLIYKGTTDRSGTLQQKIPADSREGTLVIGEEQKELKISFGYLDPIEEDRGVEKRLRNLGFHLGGVDDLSEALKEALSSFQLRFSLPVTGKIDDNTRSRLAVFHDLISEFPALNDGFEKGGQSEGGGASDSYGPSGGGQSGGGGASGSWDPTGVNFQHQVVGPEKPDNHTNTAATGPIYVIVGNGLAACVNHRTLRWSEWGKLRFDRAELVHIYELEPEPWSGYVNHDMGQWTDLLVLPGFEDEPNVVSTKYVNSTEFGRAVDHEFASIISRYNTRLIKGRIEKIQKKVVGGKDKYSIQIKGKPEVVADFVDICSGPGYARLVADGSKGKGEDFDKREIDFDKTLLKEYSDPKSNARVISAHGYMEALVNRRSGTACVFGSGALAASCVEQAFAAGCQAVYWVAKETLNVSFAPGRRYDPLVRTKTPDGITIPLQRVMGPPPNSTYLYPADPKLKIGEGYKVARVKITGKKRTTGLADAAGAHTSNEEDSSAIQEPAAASADDQADALAKPNALIEITFVTGKPDDRPSHRFVDLTKPNVKKLKSIVADQLIIAASSQSFDTESGSPAFLIKDVRDKEGSKKLTAIKAPPPQRKVPGIGEVTFGLQTENKQFRLLGAPGLNYKDRTDEDARQTRKDSRLVLYEKSIPDQTRTPVGVTISSVSIAQCNGFFQKNPNDCVNIAHPGELVTVWGLENGNKIYYARKQRIDPFTYKASSPDDLVHPLPKISGGHYRYKPPREYWP